MNKRERIKYILRDHVDERYIADLIFNYIIGNLNEKLLKDIKNLKKSQKDFVLNDQGQDDLNIWQGHDKFRLDKPIFIKIKILTRSQMIALLKEEDVIVTNYQIAHSRFRNHYDTLVNIDFEFKDKKFNGIFKTYANVR